ncbi:carboxymuconolactone decarboxylase family protein [Streptomyces sp. RY43-2]|uniref:Carboxymuconolactone decarboxylase family protein n=1 Tax=Streptomyces macrolidinus TaxID=2952607 RepID=A0ABT0ZDH0_9ACTN|nr:carboxymuconolactone decarboxylase family protein [Streptomyces macrolidinus]MCN9241629.1 carboxymuconolactone decarboxylase family protein [Streptomyces macrolidinus]
MARVSLTPRRTVFFRMMEWYSRRTYGKVLDPGKALAHQPRVLRSYLQFERAVGKWNQLDPGLKMLAEMGAAASIGCSWCMDFGYWLGRQQGMNPQKLLDVPRWRDSDVYTESERDVLEYAEAMTATPPEVDDALAARLIGRLGEPAFVELTAMVAVENLRSRINSALGLTSQGFKDSCDIPNTARRTEGTSAAR